MGRTVLGLREELARLSRSPTPGGPYITLAPTMQAILSPSGLPALKNGTVAIAFAFQW